MSDIRARELGLEFGEIVLEFLESELTWDENVADRLAQESKKLGLSTLDNNGYFKRTEI
jgi:hypothetical protein